MADQAPTGPALRYHGSKWRMAPWIIRHFSAHRIYCEPFGGGAAVLLRKPRSWSEVYNDLDCDVVNFFQVLRERTEEFMHVLSLTPFARDEFDQAYEPADDPMERARRFAILSAQGMVSGCQGKTSFRTNITYNASAVARAWAEYPERIRDVANRLRGVTIENRDYETLMRGHDSIHSLFYVDPPYLRETRTSHRKYTEEFDSPEAHGKLIDFLCGLEGKVILSGYDSDLYEERLATWWSVSASTMSERPGTGAVARTETIWLNESARNGMGVLL